MSRRALGPVLVAAALGAVFVTSRARAQGDDQPAAAPSGSVVAPSSAAPAASAMPTAPVNEPKADPYAEPVASSAPSASPQPAKKKPGTVSPEEDPLAIPEGMQGEIGSSYFHDDKPTGTKLRTGLWPFAYKERIGNEITTAVFPFYYDRRTFAADSPRTLTERESFYGLYYRKRSKSSDRDALFPFFIRWRDEQTTTTVVPPVLWRDGPNGEWHRWLAPLFFASSGPEGGYFHAPLLLTFTHRTKEKAFSLIGGLGFYDRKEKDVDWGVVPFVFAGHNADKLTSYTLIPPLLTYHAEDRDNQKYTTLVGPVYYKSTPKSTVVDIFPLFLHNHGEDSSSTTLLPLFHSSYTKEKSLFVTPVFLRSKDQDGTTTVTPFYSQYRGRTTLDIAGPIIPLYAHYVDPDIYRESLFIFPVWHSSDPTGYSWITPLFGHWREYGVSSSTWVFPTFQHVVDNSGWAFNLHPIIYTGRDGDNSHSVVAPFWWDFVTKKTRATVFFPVFWRFRDEEGTTQLALNTLWLERPSTKGPNWDFYFLPLVHVGEQPNGNSWDVLFGFVGYKREGAYKQLKLFWVPIDLTSPPPAVPATK